MKLDEWMKVDTNRWKRMKISTVVHASLMSFFVIEKFVTVFSCWETRCGIEEKKEKAQLKDTTNATFGFVTGRALAGGTRSAVYCSWGFAKTTGNQLPLAAARAEWRPLEKRRQTCKWQLGRCCAWRSRDPWEAPSCHAPMWLLSDCWLCNPLLEPDHYWRLLPWLYLKFCRCWWLKLEMFSHI